MMTHPTGLGEYTDAELFAEVADRTKHTETTKPNLTLFTPQQVEQMMNEALNQQTYKLSPNSDEKMVIVEQVRQSIARIIKKYGAGK